jgi:hypothetical protein
MTKYQAAEKKHRAQEILSLLSAEENRVDEEFTDITKNGYICRSFGCPNISRFL